MDEGLFSRSTNGNFNGFGGVFGSAPCAADQRIGRCVLDPALGIVAVYNYYASNYTESDARQHCGALRGCMLAPGSFNVARAGAGSGQVDITPPGVTCGGTVDDPLKEPCSHSFTAGDVVDGKALTAGLRDVCTRSITALPTLETFREHAPAERPPPEESPPGRHEHEAMVVPMRFSGGLRRKRFMSRSYLPILGAALITAVSCAETSKIDDTGGGGTAGMLGGAPGAGVPSYTGGSATYTGGVQNVAGTGSTPSTGGAGAVGTGGGNQGDASACAPPAGPGLDLSQFAECPTCVGKAAHCVPTTLVAAAAPNQVSQLTPCTPNSDAGAATLCVPDVLITTLGKYDPPDCASIGGGAGRCLSECIGAVANLGSFLPKATCADGEKCAPCADPRTGADTGACSLTCDTGPVEPKVIFAKCCSDQSGLCVPPDIVDATQAKALAQDSCSAGNLCAPAKFADPTFHPQTCDSVGGAEGRCLSKCVSLVSKNADLLPAGGCAANELCAPCTDPRTGELTGACSLNGDSPKKPPVLFDKQCCGTTGLCVPKSAVPAKFAAMVPVDNCAGDGGGAGWVCAPTIKLNDINAKFPKCQVLLAGIPVPAGDPNQFGGCIPKCIADAQVAANPLTGLGLAQSDCQAGWMCAPCVNPLDQTRTGACD